MKLPIPLILAFLLLLYGCTPEQDCPTTVPISFRKTTIVFPQDGLSIYNNHKEKVHLRGNVISNDINPDSIFQNCKISWYLTGDYTLLNSKDTSQYLKQSEVYGVTFTLFNEPKLTDLELIEQMEKILDGKFILKTREGRTPFYLYSNGCLSVLINYSYYDAGRFPQVSFCYGFKEDQLFYYASTPGQRYSD